MSNPLVIQIIGGLLAIFFIFLMVMCWKTWRVTHILFTFFVFAGTVTFFAFASFVLKTHAAWRSHYVDYSAAIEQAEAEQEMLLQGDLLEAEQSEDCIRSLRAELNDAVVDRGRVWPECTLTGPIDADTFRVRTVPASLPPTTQPTPNGIKPKDVMYVFAERMGPEGFKVPAYYLGEYVVDNASDMDVTISATLPLEPDQLQMINKPGMTWALYELMPLDGHEVFAKMDEQEKMLVGMDIEELKMYIPNLFNWPADKYEEFLQQFHRFNREATEDDSPEETWIQVKFVKPHSIQVDSDAEQSVLEGEGKYFDSSGRAIEGRLRQGEDGTVRFEVGDTGIFDVETADTLISDGLAEKVKSVYRRPLHDYEQFFRKAYYRRQELAATKERVERDTNTLTSLKAKADAQIAFRQDEKLKLEQDLVGFKTELANVKAYDQALQGKWQASRNRLSEMYRTNNQLAEELTRIQYQLANEINRRAAQATAQATPPTAAP